MSLTLPAYIRVDCEKLEPALYVARVTDTDTGAYLVTEEGVTRLSATRAAVTLYWAYQHAHTLLLQESLR